jgi:hypothetical protein
MRVYVRDVDEGPSSSSVVDDSARSVSEEDGAGNRACSLELIRRSANSSEIGASSFQTTSYCQSQLGLYSQSRH